MLKLQIPAQDICVAYSGGVDSHVLLHLLVQQKQPQQKIRAIHIHHGLNPQADSWQQHCETICRLLNVPLLCLAADIQVQKGESLEAVARQHRYDLLAQHLAADEVLVTGHNADDQAETVLLQLMRGAGLDGLSAMPVQKSFSQSYLLRPLLNYSRQKILAYAQAHHLQWIEDDSNINEKFDRNFMRQQVLPVLQQRWPQAIKTIARSAQQCGKVKNILDHHVQKKLATMLNRQGALALTALKSLSSEEQKLILRAWFKQLHLKMPSEIQLRQIQQDFLFSATDRNPRYDFETYVLQRQKNYLYAIAPLVATNLLKTTVITWDLNQPLLLPERLGELIVKSTNGQGFSIDVLTKKVEIRFRQGGEKFQPAGSPYRRSLKKLLQEWQVPVWQRNHLPLLYVDNALAGVVGYAIADPFVARPNDNGLVIIWQSNTA